MCFDGTPFYFFPFMLLYVIFYKREVYPDPVDVRSFKVASDRANTLDRMREQARMLDCEFVTSNHTKGIHLFAKII